MKRLIITLLLSLLLTIPFTSASNAKMTYCQIADEAARDTERRSITVNKDGSYKMLLDKGTCKDGTCIIEEMYRDCGFIKQLIDANGDGKCDYVIEWQSIVDPTYGVFFTIYNVSKKCPFII